MIVAPFIGYRGMLLDDVQHYAQEMKRRFNIITLHFPSNLRYSTIIIIITIIVIIVIISIIIIIIIIVIISLL